jgi:hypothetical protein
MQPFLILPRWVCNSDEKWVKVQGRLRPDEIADYYQGANEGTVVVLKCNSSMLVEMDILAFDQLIDKYYEYVEECKTLHGEAPLFITPELLTD